jgi:hypothetical protein
MKGINTLFSDDNDLLAEYPSILNHLPENQETFIRFHESARKDIIKDLRDAGIKIPGNGTVSKQIEAWDILDKDEVRECAKYTVLSKIFFWLSDAPEDKWERLGDKYQAEAAGALTPLITLDMNDDGKKDEGETVQPIVTLIGRL